MKLAAPIPTRNRILDAASELYATGGIGATSVRAIIGRAGVNLNAIHYHFGSKRAVTAALFEELIAPISAERQERLAILANGPASVEAVIGAFYWPVLRRAVSGSTAEQTRIAIINQLRFDPSAEARAVLAEHQETQTPEFERLLEQSSGLPEARLRTLIRFVNEAFWGLAGRAAMTAPAGSALFTLGTADAEAHLATMQRFVAVAIADLASAQSSSDGSGTHATDHRSRQSRHRPRSDRPPR